MGELLNNQLTESKELFNHMQVDELKKHVDTEPIISNNVHQEVLFENEALKQQVEALKKTLEEVGRKITIENENKEELEVKDKEKFDRYDENIRNLQGKLSSATEDLSKKSAELEVLIKEKEQLNAKISSSILDMESNKENLETDIRNLKSENESLKTQLEDINKVASDKKIDQYDEDMKNLQAKLSSATEDLSKKSA